MIFVFGVMGVLLGVAAAWVGTRRSAAQRVSQSPEAERVVAEIAERRPDLAVVAAGAGIIPSFTRREHQERFEAALQAAFQAGWAPLTEEEAAEFLPEDDEAVRFVCEGMRVLGDHEDRVSFPGALPVVQDPDGHLRFVRKPMSASRAMLGAALCAVATATLAWLPFGLWGAMATAALITYSFTASITDHDTLLIDMWTFSLGTSLSWGLIFTGAFTGEMPWFNVIAGGIGVAVWVVLFAVLNVYSVWRRGMLGIGFGDSMMVMATVGVPVALTGRLEVAIWSVLLSMVFALAHRGTAVALKLASRSRPFALVPYLAAGWLPATLMFTL